MTAGSGFIAIDPGEHHHPRREHSNDRRQLARTCSLQCLQAFDDLERIAAADAFDKALQAAGAVLLEPIMKLQITTPEEHLGAFTSDLQQRRATITHTQQRGKNVVIEAEAPLANLFGYSSAMRGLSQGRASATMEPAAYGPAPQEVAETFV